MYAMGGTLNSPPIQFGCMDGTFKNIQVLSLDAWMER